MAEENENQAAEGNEESSPKGSSPLKAIIIIVVVLLLEGVTIVGTMMMSGGPAPAQAIDVETELEDELNKLVEVLVVSGKFDNQRSGRTYLYDTEVFVTVRNKNFAQFETDLESVKTQLSVDVQTVFRRAEPAHFQEPTRATLTRQIKAKLDERFGKDGNDEPVIEAVLIGKCLPYRTDY